MSSTVPFRILRAELERHGWHLDRIRGSHHIFKHAIRPNVTIAVHKNQCKRVYERITQKAIQDLKASAGES